MNHNDAKLIERTLEGDEQAFAALVEKYQDRIHTLAWQKISDFHIAQEITQDVFITAYQKLATLKNPNRFAGWLYTITNRKCITWYRKKTPQPQSLEDTDPIELEEVYYSEHVSREREEATKEKRHALVHKLLSKLRESDRTVITLHYLTGLSCEEIGQFLGVSTNTVKSRLHRARNRLKKEEGMIQEILGGFQFSTELTANVMKEISQLGPVAPSGGSPLVPLAISAAVCVSFVLLIGIGMQYYFGPQNTGDVNLPSAQEDTQLSPIIRAPEYTRWGLPKGAIARLGKGKVHEIKYSPNGKLLAVATDNGIWFYDAETTQELALMKVSHGVFFDVFSIAFSPDGKTLVSGGNGGLPILWDVNTRTVKSRLSGPGALNAIFAIAFSSNGRMLATGRDNGVQLWDVDTGELKATLQENEEHVNSVVFSPNGRTVASGSKDAAIRLWDVESATLTAKLIGHTREVKSVAFSLDGKTVASGSRDRTVRLWDVGADKLKVTLKGHTNSVTSVSFSPDGEMLASGSMDNTIHLWDVSSGTDLQTTPIDTYVGGDSLAHTSVAFSPDGDTLTSTSADGTIRMWKIATGKHINTILGHLSVITSVSFSPDGNTLASTGDNTVHLWNVNTATYKNTLIGHTNRVVSATFSPDGKILASGSWDKTIRLWDVATGKRKSMLTNHTGRIKSVIFSPDGKMLASGSNDETVRLWDVATGTLKATFTGHTDTVLSVSFSPDSRLLASGSEDNSIRLWDVAAGTHRVTLTGHTRDVNSVVFSPDGTKLASVSDDKTARLWDVAQAKQIASLKEKGRIWVQSVSFSPDGHTVACGSMGQIDLWDVSTLSRITTIKGHQETVMSVVFDPNGNILASGALDGVVYLWDLKAFIKPQE